MSKKAGHMMNEVDIGSGEKNLGEQETQRQIEQIQGDKSKEKPAGEKNTPPQDKVSQRKPS